MKKRKRAVLVVGVFFVLLFAFYQQLILYMMAEREAEQAHNQRFYSVLFAEEFRQSSDDLTRAIRMYALTSNPSFKNNFAEVLDIRNGLKPRHVVLQKTYWDTVHEDSNCPSFFGEARPLMEIARCAGFTSEEYGMLEKAMQTSDDLVEVEKAAMDVLERDPDSAACRLEALEMVISDTYMARKSQIMALVDNFQLLVVRRTQAIVAEAVERTEVLRIWVIGLGILLAGALIGLLVMEERRAARFENNARRDALTGLPNRFHLEWYLRSVCSKAEAHGEIVVLAFIDLNGFKPINDELGHAQGDLVLKKVAEGLNNHCRSGDLAVRYGGDEFVVVITAPSSHRNESVTRINNMIHSVFKNLTAELDQGRIGAAVGISIFPHPATSVEMLIKTADEAMYQVKGRDELVAINEYNAANLIAI
jgi:diguanylate cyclase (GGDEF)-like protein